MIYANLESKDEMPFLDKKIKLCFEYAKKHDLLKMDTGCHKIDGDNLFVNVVEYETTSAEKRFWEAHKEYLDLHLMLRGEEQIDIGFVENMQIKPYEPKDDFLPMDGEKNASVILRDNDFLICYPNDGHRTAVAVQSPQKIKKAIFKIKI